MFARVLPPFRGPLHPHPLCLLTPAHPLSFSSDVASFPLISIPDFHQELRSLVAASASLAHVLITLS